MIPRARTQMWGVPSRSCPMISAEAHSSLPTTAGLHGVRFQSLCLHPPATARFPVPVPHSRVAPPSLAKMVFCHLVFFRVVPGSPIWGVSQSILVLLVGPPTLRFRHMPIPNLVLFLALSNRSWTTARATQTTVTILRQWDARPMVWAIR